MTIKPNNVTSLIKKRDLKKVKEILSIEFVCIHDSIYSCLKDFVSVETMKRLKF